MGRLPLAEHQVASVDLRLLIRSCSGRLPRAIPPRVLQARRACVGLT